MSIFRNGVRMTMESGSDSYLDIENKPVVNGTELVGNMTITPNDIVAVATLPTTNINQKKFYMCGTTLYWCSNPNTPSWEIISNGGQTVQSIINSMHPVGSIYITTSATNPSTLFGGNWIALHNVFLAAAGTEFSAGTTGGSSTFSYTPKGTNTGAAFTFSPITISVSNLPSHTHNYTPKGNVSVATYPTFTGSQITSGGSAAAPVASIGSHSHKFSSYHTSKSKSSTLTVISYSENYDGTTSITYSSVKSGATVAASGHTHVCTAQGTISGGAWTYTNGGQVTSTSTGSGSAITPTTKTVTQPKFTGDTVTASAIPPYTTVYMWRRTS